MMKCKCFMSGHEYMMRIPNDNVKNILFLPIASFSCDRMMLSTLIHIDAVARIIHLQLHMAAVVSGRVVVVGFCMFSSQTPSSTTIRRVRAICPGRTTTLLLARTTNRTMPLLLLLFKPGNLLLLTRFLLIRCGLVRTRSAQN